MSDLQQFITNDDKFQSHMGSTDELLLIRSDLGGMLGPILYLLIRNL